MNFSWIKIFYLEWPGKNWSRFGLLCRFTRAPSIIKFGKSGGSPGSRDTFIHGDHKKGHFISSTHFIKSFVSQRFSRHARVRGNENRAEVQDLSCRTFVHSRTSHTHTRGRLNNRDLLFPLTTASRIGLFIIGLRVDLVSKFYVVPTGFTTCAASNFARIAFLHEQTASFRLLYNRRD